MNGKAVCKKISQHVYPLAMMAVLAVCIGYRVCYSTMWRAIEMSTYTMTYIVWNLVLVRPLLCYSAASLVTYLIKKQIPEKVRKLCIGIAVLIVGLYLVLILLWVLKLFPPNLIEFVIGQPGIFAAVGVLATLGLKNRPRGIAAPFSV